MTVMIQCDYCKKYVSDEDALNEMQRINIDLEGQGSEEGSIRSWYIIHFCVDKCLSLWEQYINGFELKK